jgi:NAD(P)-dependent dehydrogenase (short-subunit alcohol dehydrogenase family)
MTADGLLPSQHDSEVLDRQPITVTVLANNAGLGATGAFLDLEPAVTERMLAVNAIALTDITRALLPGILATGHGAVVNVASFVGYQPGPGMAVYAATKAYVLSFTEAPRPRTARASGQVATALRALDATRTPARVVSGRSNRLALALLHRLPRRTMLSLLAAANQRAAHA